MDEASGLRALNALVGVLVTVAHRVERTANHISRARTLEQHRIRYVTLPGRLQRSPQSGRVNASELCENRIADKSFELRALVPQRPHGTGANMPLATTGADRFGETATHGGAQDPLRSPRAHAELGWQLKTELQELAIQKRIADLEIVLERVQVQPVLKRLKSLGCVMREEFSKGRQRVVGQIQS